MTSSYLKIVIGESSTKVRNCDCCGYIRVDINWIRVCEEMNVKTLNMGESGSLKSVYLGCPYCDPGWFYEWSDMILGYGGLCADPNELQREYKSHLDKL